MADFEEEYFESDDDSETNTMSDASVESDSDVGSESDSDDEDKEVKLQKIIKDKDATVEVFEEDAAVEEEDEEIFDDIPNETVLLKKYDITTNTEDLKRMKREKKTRPILSKYEKAKLIAERAVQISKGAPVMVNVSAEDRLNPIMIAERELYERKIPLMVRRYYHTSSGAKYEDWRIDDFLIV